MPFNAGHLSIGVPVTNPLTVLPPKARKYVYAALGLAALALAAYKASQGDWVEFAGLLLGSLGFGQAHVNTDTSQPTEVEAATDDAGN